MKLKDRAWTDVERRPGADSQLLPNTRIVRTTLLAITAVALAALAWMAVYLICLSPPFEDGDPGRESSPFLEDHQVGQNVLAGIGRHQALQPVCDGVKRLPPP